MLGFFTVMQDYPEPQFDTDGNKKIYVSAFAMHSFTPKIGAIDESKQRQIIDILEMPDDWYNMLAYAILKKVAEENNWKHFSIVEDSYAFDDGLCLIGYVNESAKKGYEDGELGHCCLDVSAIKNNKVHFDNNELYKLPEYLNDHNVGIMSRKGMFQWRPYLAC